MNKPRPSMFIGSSAEGLTVAEAIQLNLDYACEVTIWSQGVFGLGKGTLETLVDRLADFDFAALVLTPDDITLSRDNLEQSPRDNVLLELGMFIGALGRERSFIVYDRGTPMKLPTDLAGVTPATFQKHSTGNLQSSLGAATSLIKGTIGRLGKKTQKISANVDENTTFQIIHDLLDPAPEQFIIWMHESGKTMVRTPSHLSRGVTFEYSLQNRGGMGSFSIDELCRKLPDAGLLQADLRHVVTLTDRGHAFAEWLTDNGHKAKYFRSDVGQWGHMPPGGGFPWSREYAPSWPDANVQPAVEPGDSEGKTPKGDE